jgi:hypothetical protein
MTWNMKHGVIGDNESDQGGAYFFQFGFFVHWIILYGADKVASKRA